MTRRRKTSERVRPRTLPGRIGLVGLCSLLGLANARLAHAESQASQTSQASVAAAPSPPPSPRPGPAPSSRAIDLRWRPSLARHLKMRPEQRAAAAATGPTSATAAPSTARPAAARKPAAPDAPMPTGATLRTGREELVFRFDLGFALDGAALSTEAKTLAGNQIDNAAAQIEGTSQLAQVRSYGFGDLFLGSRGLVLPNLTAFLSAHYRLSNVLDSQLAPIAESQYDANELQVRSGWAEIKDPSRRRWLSPLRLRAGRFYIYGPWVTHVDGLTIAWDGPAVQATATFGDRVTSLTSGQQSGSLEPTAQLTVRGDLTALKRGLPAVASAEVLRIGGRSHLHTQIAWQPRPTLAIGLSARTLDSKPVNQRLSIRGRFRDINAVFAEVVHRNRDDWQWDPVVISLDESNTAEPRRYLDLGPSRPRLTAQMRAGTVLFDNIDILARAATALDLRDDGSQASSFSAPYLELGGALEIRLRRTLAVGASITTRNTNRETVAPAIDADGPMTLPLDGGYGDESFVEGGGTARLTLGARTLTVAGELYARRTTYAALYRADVDPDTGIATPIDYETTHLGGRTSVDAWINRKLRVLARYEVVTQVKRAPEVTGFKSLRVIVEATF